MSSFFILDLNQKSRIRLFVKKFSLRIVNNKSIDEYIVRIDSSGLDFYITICFFSKYQFEVDFIPANENWSRHKVKKYNHIDDLFFDLEDFASYDLISIEESERDMF